MGKAKGEAARTKSRPSSSRFLDIFFFFVLLLLFLINSVWGSNQCHARIIEKEKRKTIAAWLLHYCHRVLRPWVSVALLEVHLWTLRSLQPLMPLLLRSVLNNLFIYLLLGSFYVGGSYFVYEVWIGEDVFILGGGCSRISMVKWRSIWSGFRVRTPSPR